MLGAVAATPPEQIPDVVRAAARVQPLWALLRVGDRARYMRRVAQAIIDERDELLDAISREQGRPRTEVLTLELLPAIDALHLDRRRGRRRARAAPGPGARGSCSRSSARASRSSRSA